MVLQVFGQKSLDDLAQARYETTKDSLNVLGISTTNMPKNFSRKSTSEDALVQSLKHAEENHGAKTKLIKLRELDFRNCEGYYSTHERGCTWPCTITQTDPKDQLTDVYNAMVLWADIVLISTPIRWGSPSALYHQMAERLNCVQNQITLYDNVLIKNKVAGFIITGGQDNIQAVAGGMMTFWSELGFVFPQFPFIAHSRGWDAEDMQTNVRQVKASEALRTAARELAGRAIDFWWIVDRHRAEMGKPMERAGRKAQSLVAREAATT